MPNPPGMTSDQVRAVFRPPTDLEQVLHLAELEMNVARAHIALRDALLSTRDVGRGQGHPLAHPSDLSPNIVEIELRVADARRAQRARSSSTDVGQAHPLAHPIDSSPIPPTSAENDTPCTHRNTAFPDPHWYAEDGTPWTEEAAGNDDERFKEFAPTALVHATEKKAMTAGPPVDDETPPARAPPVPATDGAAPPVHDFQQSGSSAD